MRASLDAAEGPWQVQRGKLQTAIALTKVGRLREAYFLHADLGFGAGLEEDMDGVDGFFFCLFLYGSSSVFSPFFPHERRKTPFVHCWRPYDFLGYFFSFDYYYGYYYDRFDDVYCCDYHYFIVMIIIIILIIILPIITVNIISVTIIITAVFEAFC